MLLPMQGAVVKALLPPAVALAEADTVLGRVVIDAMRWILGGFIFFRAELGLLA